MTATPHTDTDTRFQVLDTWISALSLSRAAQRILDWVREDRRETVHLCTTDTTLKAYDSPLLSDIINHAGLVGADGMPLVWLGRMKGHRVGRVYGPDLMLRVIREGLAGGVRHFFYGDTEETLKALTQALSSRFPSITIAGFHAPPFRPLTDAEKRADAAWINSHRPDIVWVGLGTPKQDFWVAEYRPLLTAKVLIPVGAAFRFHAGILPQAPRWLMSLGLEWLFRLASEPRRLWRRYVLGIPRFLYFISLQRTHRHSPDRATTAADPKTLNVLGVGIAPVNLQETLELMTTSIRSGKKGYLCVTGVHGVMESYRDAAVRKAHNEALACVPDGMPMSWIGWGYGHHKMDRVYGPDLMLRTLELAAREGWTHFFYGGRPGVADTLRERMVRRIPGLRVVGTYCPPFRPLTGEERAAFLKQIDDVRPDIVWIGISTPRQELLMADLLPDIHTRLMLGVGAAFDFHTGRVRQAPHWIQRMGMEWCFRLCMEPRRLWPRYRDNNPLFLCLIALQLTGCRKFPDPKTGDSPRSKKRYET